MTHYISDAVWYIASLLAIQDHRSPPLCRTSSLVPPSIARAAASALCLSPARGERWSICAVKTKDNSHSALRARQGTSARWVDWIWYRSVEHWAIRSSVCSFRRTAHSFATLRTASFSRALRCADSLAPTAHSLALNLMGKKYFFLRFFAHQFYIIST